MAEISQWIGYAAMEYGVDPAIFAVLYVGTVPLYLISVAKIVQHLRARARDRARFWAGILLISFVPSYGYVAVAAENVPFWVYAVLVAAALLAAYTGAQRLRNLFDAKYTSAGAPEREGNGVPR